MCGGGGGGVFNFDQAKEEGSKPDGVGYVEE